MRRFVVLWLIGFGASGAGCGERVADRVAEVPAALPAPAAKRNADVMEKWTRSCALCHVNGEGGAPRVSAPEEWKARLASGEEQLLTHTIEGYNNMPPLGYCMDCDREDFLQIIRFMTAGS